ncbi:hypothetical protein [Croceicoccus naphthovorans]|nr:hypothetical protein [Croceicoccus naphthovorans]MBB3990301.1 hypothetical protein [Croceicoccus naphthovorans]
MNRISMLFKAREDALQQGDADAYNHLDKLIEMERRDLRASAR